jgi:hypothetical protein
MFIILAIWICTAAQVAPVPTAVIATGTYVTADIVIPAVAHCGSYCRVY